MGIRLSYLWDLLLYISLCHGTALDYIFFCVYSLRGPSYLGTNYRPSSPIHSSSWSSCHINEFDYNNYCYWLPWYGFFSLRPSLISTPVSSKDFKHFYHHFEVVNFLLILTFCITNIFFTLGMLRYGISLQKRVKRSPITCLADQQRREQIIRRINVVLIVCATCFSLRLIALGALSYSLLNDTDPLSGIGLVGWFTVSYWIPFILPVTGLFRVISLSNPGSHPPRDHESLSYTTSHSANPFSSFSRSRTNNLSKRSRISPDQSRSKSI